MAKKAKTFNVKSKVVSAIRKIWLYSPNRREAVKRAKEDKDYFRCEKCNGLCEKIQIDHKIPTVPLTGWDGYDYFIGRMFCAPDELQSLCVRCHDKLTKEQNVIRKKNKKNV